MNDNLSVVMILIIDNYLASASLKLLRSLALLCLSATVKMKTALDTSVPKFLALVMSLYCAGCPETTIRNLPSVRRKWPRKNSFDGA